MDTITSNGSVTFAIDGLNLTGNLQLQYYVSQSLMEAVVANIATGAWIGLPTQSLADIRYVYVSNNGVPQTTAGSVNIATDNAGTKLVAIMQPGDFVLLPWSGSTQLYARAYNNSSSITTIIASS